MMSERVFVAESMAARHCPELLRAGPAPAELVPALARLGERMARVLAASLSTLSGGEAPIVRCLTPRECTAGELAADIGPLAANTLIASGAGNFLASLDAAAVLRLVDRAFGGRGEAPSPLPTAFPLSAELMIARLEGIVLTAAGQVLGGPVEALRRDGDIAQLAPFSAAERLAVMTLGVEDGARAPWNIAFAFPLAMLPELLGSDQAAAPRPVRGFQPNPADEPFGDLPLTLEAVLVDMRVAFSTLSALQVGQILPVAVARSIPLKVGDKTIAHGTIGAVDDRVAVQITQAF